MNDTIEVTLNNKKTIQVNNNTTIMELALNNSDLCQDKIVGAKINNEIVDFNRVITKPVNIDFIDVNDIDGYKMNQAGLKFVLEVALKNKYKGIEVTYDHSMGNGVHATILNYDNFNEDNLKVLREEMDKLIAQHLLFEKINVTSKEAINYLTKFNYIEKASNIHNITNNIVLFYKLGNRINYYYSEMPYSTEYLSDYELVYINKNEILLVLPFNNTFNVIEYKMYDKIAKCFKVTLDYLNKYEMPYLSNINAYVSNGHVNDVIQLFENAFNLQIYEITKKIISKNTKFLLISGPSSSGKTTTAKKICLHMQTLGYHPYLISTDDYFVDKEKSPKKSDGTYDFESIECIDINRLNRDLKDLLNGREVILPKYNFKTGKREYYNQPIKFKDNSIVVIEGIHCLNDRFAGDLDSSLVYRIYLSPFMANKIDRHNYISTTDLRLLRRIIRDNNNRGCDITRTFDLWYDVRKGEEENIFPYLNRADDIINTSLPYELGVLKVYAEPLLYSITNDSKYLEEARRLISFLKGIYSIPPDYVSGSSILREFIGGSTFKREGDI